MKKSLIAAAIAAAVAAPAANAGVVLYGKIHVSIDYLSQDKELLGYNMNDSVENAEAWYVASRDSRIGFKGTEDLGNGLSLIWKAETEYDIDDGGWGGGRNAYIGLTGDWGTFLYGRHDTPMKISTGKLDLFGDQLGDYNWRHNTGKALLGPGFHDVRAGNAIAYISPNWNGFTFAGAIVPGEGAPDDNDEPLDGLADSYSVAGMYSNNGLYLAAAYEELAGTYISDSDDYISLSSLTPAFAPLHGAEIDYMHALKKWRVGAGYTMNAFTLNFVYENQDTKVHVDGLTAGEHEEYDGDLWQISGAYDFGNNRVKLAYGQNKGEAKDTGGNEVKAEGKSTHWALGLDHKLSKRTTAYVQYAEAKADDVTQVEGDGDRREPIDGGKTSGFSMGLIHTF